MTKELFIKDEDVEREIERLQASDYVRLAKKEENIVRLAKKEENIRCRRRQYMYNLRSYEKRGRQLAAKGYTLDNIEDLFE